METAYYVMHPSLGVTAVVHAPSTEKARTTFLDWLERNHLMRRADRQQLRKNMVAKRLEDPNVQSDVVLHYGYRDVMMIGKGIGAGFEGRGPAGLGIEIEEGTELPPEPAYDVLGKRELKRPEELVPIELPEEEKGPRMPIQKVMLRGFG